MFTTALLLLSLNGDCGDCAGSRQGILSRRAERRAERRASACSTCESAEVVTETQQPAVITTRTVQPIKTVTGPKKSTTTITPTGAAQQVAPKTK